MRVGRVLGLVFTLVTSVSAMSVSVLAQQATVADTSMARRLFEQGLVALEEERWEDARGAFTRSYALVPRPNTLLNLATAQAELNLPVEAIESYRAFIQLATRRERRHTQDAERAIAELETRIAHVELDIPDLERSDVIELDQEELPAEAILSPLSLSPGRHVLLVRRGEDTIGRVELVLVEGETRGLELALHPPARVVQRPALIEAPPEPSDDTALGVGIGVAVGVVAIGVGIVLAVLFYPTEDPYVGNLGPGMVTF